MGKGKGKAGKVQDRRRTKTVRQFLLSILRHDRKYRWTSWAHILETANAYRKGYTLEEMQQVAHISKRYGSRYFESLGNDVRAILVPRKEESTHSPNAGSSTIPTVGRAEASRSRSRSRSGEKKFRNPYVDYSDESSDLD